MPRRIVPTLVLGILGAPAFTAPSVAQPGPDGIDWVTIGAPGNAPYTGFNYPLSPTYGRGGVDYEYRIARTELTTAQALEFFNAAFARPDPLPFSSFWFHGQLQWGATRDTSYLGPGVRYRLRNIPDAADLPVGGLSWRAAAIMANWLHNDKRTDQAAFLDGAYDTSTFTGGFPTFGDQPAHHPGARYWIPTLDEWMKAAHYDPHANGGQGRWWEQPNGTDIPLVYAPPPSFGGDGTGQANAGFGLPGEAQFNIPVGSYPSVVSPWGLLDVAGGPNEWLEEIKVDSGGEMSRVMEGSAWRHDPVYDLVYRWGSDMPRSNFFTHGVRFASAVPAPASLCYVVGSFLLLTRRRPATSGPA